MKETVVILLLIGLMVNLEHDYELSRGRKMWSGAGRAVHYLDRFSFLTTEMQGIWGIMSSNYAFKVDKQWSLAFRLKREGQLSGKKDGFMFMLSPKNIDLAGYSDKKGNKDFTKAAVS